MKCFVWSVVIVAIIAGVGPDSDMQDYKSITRKPEDQVKIVPKGGAVVFAISSPSGIGDATIERQKEAWPKTVTLKLHLKGLESLRITAGETSLGAAVSMHDGKLKARLWKDNKEEQAIDAKSPFWMPIRAVGADGKLAQKLPVEDGFFEMTLPAALLTGNPKSIRVHWIDFHRN